MKPLLLFFLLALPSILHTQSDGDKHPILSKRLILQAGWFSPSEEVNLGIAGRSDQNTDQIQNIDFDERLALSGGNNTFNFHFKWRFSRSKLWYSSGEYFSISTERSIELEEEIQWEEVTYPVGASVDLGYSISLYRISFGRVISSGDRHELSAGIGIHSLRTKGFIEGSVFIDEQSSGIERREESAFLPLPNIGAAYIWAPSQHWAFLLRADWFGITIDNISGGLWNISPGISFAFSRHLGLTGAYQFLNFKANIDQENWSGSFDLRFGGPSLRLVGAF